jgi:hypothetical protein
MLGKKFWLSYALADDTAGILTRGLCRATEIYEDTFLALGALFARDQPRQDRVGE